MDGLFTGILYAYRNEHRLTQVKSLSDATVRTNRFQTV